MTEGCGELDGGDRLRYHFDLKFDGPNIASFTVTIYRNGIELSTDTGILDFQKGSPGNRLPTELVPPRSPPQAAGKDYSGVGVAAPTTTRTITGDSLQSLLVRNADVQTVAYRSGDWLEPKDGSNQRMMVVGADHGAPAVALSPKRAPLGFRSAAFATVEPEFTPLGRSLHAAAKRHPGARRKVLLAAQDRQRACPSMPARLCARGQQGDSGMRLGLRKEHRQCPHQRLHDGEVRLAVLPFGGRLTAAYVAGYQANAGLAGSTCLSRQS